MGRYAKFSSSLLFLFFFLQFVSSQIPSDQITIMRRVYQLLQKETGSSFPWNSAANDSNPCSWRGVSCKPDNSSINKISLRFITLSSSNSLPVLCQIGTLESIDLSNNFLSSIPDGFFSGCGKISGFKLLNISRNNLGGSLPIFQDFARLEHLDLSHNFLSGTIGLQLNGLVSLKSLNLSYNKFSGPVPTNFGNSNLLEEFVLSSNNFQGLFPQEFVIYGNLTLIDLSTNKVFGSIPDRISELSKLETLVLSDNNLSGGIPQSLSSISTLRRFAANQNQFTGKVPAGITRYLRRLDLSFNHLSGPIPVDLLSPSSLQSVDLSFNTLVGSIPMNMSPSLVRLRFKSNSLNGTLPLSFGSLQELTYLELDHNKLSGSIPAELGLCKHLALLDLAENNLTGVTPAALGNLSNLQVLNLQVNKLVGVIPHQLVMLTKLQRLNISWNSLSGQIPPSISSLKNLTNLGLQGNNLIGSIPEGIGSLNFLLELQLGTNQLTGTIPSMPLKLQIALNLSSNLLEGSIPISLSSLTGLEVLDLSKNSLAGDIPDFLARMSSLTQLNLSNNNLSGVVPKFGLHVDVDTDGNMDLIYHPTSSLIPSPAPAKPRKAIAVVLAIAISVAVMAAGIITLIVLSISRRFHRINDEHLESGEEISQPQVIHENLLTAHAIHRSSIDFTKAMEAVADPSNIILKTKFSTYYKALMPSGISYFVKKVNWSDKIFQLGSHEKFGEELEVLGKLSNSNVMIPLAYVLSADSAYLFYEFSECGTLFDVLHGNSGNCLDWASRYSIAIGIAQALSFLHGYSSSPICLLDLSSMGILLKCTEEPQVGDIELCKVIDPSKSTGNISTVAGSVGYIPPEYAYTMRITMAGNVYSFGVILLELLTGKPAVSQGTELAKWVLSKSQQQGKLDHILDFTVSRTSLAIKSQMLAVLKVALACVSISPEARPKMKSVLRMLLNAR